MRVCHRQARSRRATGCAVSLLVFLLALPVGAVDPEAGPVNATKTFARVRELWKSGQVLFRKGNFHGAEGQLREAAELLNVLMKLQDERFAGHCRDFAVVQSLHGWSVKRQRGRSMEGEMLWRQCQANPDWCLPAEHVNALRPAPARETSSEPVRRVLGQWDFEQGDLRATTGHALRYHDPKADDQSKAKTKFGRASDFGLPVLGRDVGVLHTLGYSLDSGLEMTTDPEPNGGGCFLNQYTLICDLLIPEDGLPHVWWALHQTWHLSINDAEACFHRGKDGKIGMGIRGAYGGEGNELKRNTWHRVAIVVDLTKAGDNYFKYIDGKRVGVQQVGEMTFADGKYVRHPIDGRHAIRPVSLLFTDDNETGYLFVSSLQLRNYAMTEGEIAELGGPEPDGILRRLGESREAQQ
ncbi:MAG: hypothetical protein HN742_08145 [Lentisphaerae bacterium]|jgi:hypothetical protein|nr:hypothetical protein [Lentisphaerota bacterium]MBT4814300.1 hypothetical protein [Lentisphaerota bacterium]MBT5613073.1 hypothetical protein [Lentisphaerota bacterium]MBT7059332.1 hypothetical protein [Lentisphaerota bacterium]MBT7841828.1 hypothetical protein [Lentisphaerota bacterium]